MDVALAAFSGLQVELKIAVLIGGFENVCERLVCQGSAAQVGVQNDPGSVDD